MPAVSGRKIISLLRSQSIASGGLRDIVAKPLPYLSRWQSRCHCLYVSLRGSMGLKILVVDDEAGIRDNLVRLLRLEGFDVVEANDGRAGLDMARLEMPDLVLSDVMMPVLDGYGFLEALRADPTTAAI